jgi:midasin
VAEDEAVQVPQSGEQRSEQETGGEEGAMDMDDEQSKPKKEDKKRDREGGSEKKGDGAQESAEASRLKKKMRQEQEKERLNRLGDFEDPEDEEVESGSFEEGITGSHGDGGEEEDEEEEEKGTKTQEGMDITDIGGKVYTNSRDQDRERRVEELDGDDAELAIETEGGFTGGVVVPQSARLEWARHRAATETHAMRLCEQLRLVLEPTLATRLQGDYRTGKRINMRRVVGYVASGFRKDKIWLRRTKPAKRDYQVK